MKPIYRVRLRESPWSLVITDTGNRFYYNEEEGKSVWDYPDEEVAQKVHDIGRDEILVMIAKARGMRVETRGSSSESFTGNSKGNSRGVASERGSFQRQAKQQFIVENEKQKQKQHQPQQQHEQQQHKEENENKKENVGIAISGYSSSGDESEEEDEEEEEEEEALQSRDKHSDDSSSEESDSNSDSDANTNHMIDLAELDSESENDNNATVNATNSDLKSAFFGLLSQSNINYYSPWEEESKKIINDPLYVEIELDVLRKEYFDEWCSLQAAKEQENETEEENNSNIDLLKPCNVSFSPEIEFLSILSTNFRPGKLYIDFKRKNRDVLPQLNDRRRETLYVEFASFKKKPLEIRIANLKKKLAKLKLAEEAQNVGQALEQLKNKVDELDLEVVRKVLKNVEAKLNLDRVMDASYFAVPSRERLKVVMEAVESKM